MPKERKWKELMAITPGEPPFNDECDCAESIELREKVEEAERLIALALDFWSAPRIDMPDISTFDDMVTFMGDKWGCKWLDGEYVGDPIKPVGMAAEDHYKRELLERLSKRDRDDVYEFAMRRSREIKEKAEG